MDVLPIGNATLVTFKFRNTPIFPVAPLFDLILEDDTVLLSGSTTVSAQSGGWDVNLTIPSTFKTETGGTTVTLEVYGTDSTGKIRSEEKEFRVLDAVEDYTPIGLIVQENENFEDTIILDNANYDMTTLFIQVMDWEGNVLLPTVGVEAESIKRVADRNELPDRFSTPKFSGYQYTVEIPGTSIVYPKKQRNALQLVYTARAPNGRVKKTEVHPIYRLNSRWFMHLNSLRQFLDKARLIEIDETLQWQDDELCQSLIEGMNYINSFPDTITWYTVDDIISPLHTPLMYAAALHALNARYLAEGFTAFEFTGLSTNLQVDRKDAISYKIEELKGFIDANLRKIKQSVIATVGVGTTTEVTPTTEAIGVLGLNISPVNNVIRRTHGRNPFRQF